MKVNNKTVFISRLALLVSLTVIVQIAGFPQPITGPLINFFLFMTATLLGRIAGMTLGSLTPLIALLRGQLPAVLAPLAPIIAVANIILVLVYYWLNYKIIIPIRLFERLKIYSAIILAAVAKYLFFILIVKIIFPQIFNISIPGKIALVLLTPQLLTALAGGILFIIVLKIMNRAGLWRQSYSDNLHLI